MDVKTSPKECNSVKDKYLYIITNYDVTSQDRFRELYNEVFHHKPTQSTVAHNFKKYFIEKSAYSGLYESKFVPHSMDDYTMINTITEIVDEYSKQEINEETKQIVNKLAKEIKQVLFDWKLSGDNKRNEVQKQIQEQASFTLGQLFQSNVDNVIYSEVNNTLTIQLKNAGDVIKKRFCECLDQFGSDNWQYTSIISGYNSIILYSPKTKEILDFCNSVKFYYSNPIIEIQ